MQRDSAPAPEAEFLFRGHESDVRAVSFLPDGRGLLSADAAGVIVIWSLDTKRPLRKWQAHSRVIYAMEVIQGTSSAPTMSLMILSQARDGLLRVWDARQVMDVNVLNEDVQCVLELPVNPLTFCRFSWCVTNAPHHLLLALSNLDNSERIDVYNLTQQQFITKAIHTTLKSGMCLCTKLFNQPPPSDTSTPKLAAGYEDGSVTIWAALHASMIGRIDIFKEPIFSLDVHHEGLKGVAAGAENRIATFSIEFDEAGSTKSLQYALLPSAGIADVAIRGDGRIVATAGWDSKIRIFAMKKLRPLAVLTAHRDGVQCVAFAWKSHWPDSRERENEWASLLATGSKDKRVALYKIY
ncbi:hypothetical protein SeMB42_g05457 [Synchytrium endobioticum]|uniref:ASTRA-associated protein 1 n=1 Tax=Synchytrium endobioticum TaxID=286115 RepID=A0A507CRA6_9FUNG|nr:hypothetical protein SeMB42_g05457 [Synchytrium endobioticum]